MNLISPAYLRFSASPASQKTQADTDTGAEEPFFRQNPFGSAERPIKPKKTESSIGNVFSWIKSRFTSEPYLSLQDKQLQDLLDRLSVVIEQSMDKQTLPLKIRRLSRTNIGGVNYIELNSNCVEDIKSNRIEPTEIVLNGKTFAFEYKPGVNQYVRSNNYSSWHKSDHFKQYVLKGDGITLTCDLRKGQVEYQDSQASGSVISNNKVVFKQAKNLFLTLLNKLQELENFSQRPLQPSHKLRL